MRQNSHCLFFLFLGRVCLCLFVLCKNCFGAIFHLFLTAGAYVKYWIHKPRGDKNDSDDNDDEDDDKLNLNVTFDEMKIDELSALEVNVNDLNDLDVPNNVNIDDYCGKYDLSNKYVKVFLSQFNDLNAIIDESSEAEEETKRIDLLKPINLKLNLQKCDLLSNILNYNFAKLKIHGSIESIKLQVFESILIDLLTRQQSSLLTSQKPINKSSNSNINTNSKSSSNLNSNSNDYMDMDSRSTYTRNVQIIVSGLNAMLNNTNDSNNNNNSNSNRNNQLVNGIATRLLQENETRLNRLRQDIKSEFLTKQDPNTQHD